jgi:hypothetical protein
MPFDVEDRPPSPPGSRQPTHDILRRAARSRRRVEIGPAWPVLSDTRQPERRRRCCCSPACRISVAWLAPGASNSPGERSRSPCALPAQRRTTARAWTKGCRAVKAGHQPPADRRCRRCYGEGPLNGQLDRGVVECVVEPRQALKWLRRASREVRWQRGAYRQADRFDAQIAERGSGSDGRPKLPLRRLGCCPLSRRCRVRSRGQVR